VRFECGNTSVQLGPEGIAIETPGSIQIVCDGNNVVLQEHHAVLRGGAEVWRHPGEPLLGVNFTAGMHSSTSAGFGQAFGSLVSVFHSATTVTLCA